VRRRIARRGLVAGAIIAIAALVIWWRFDSDIQQARARIAHGSVLVATRCGLIEYREAGTGMDFHQFGRQIPTSH
jgi:hypothetical protein